MNKAPFITIVIPAHNSVGTIRQVLNSILDLDYPKDRLELVIVDDSTDETPHILQEFISQYGNIFRKVKLIRLLKECGVSCARNIGMREASGDYIFLLDSDVVLQRETLRYMLETLDSCFPCIVSMFYIHERSSLIERLVLYRYRDRIKEGPLFTGAAMIPRSLIFKVGLFNEELGYPYGVYEDWEYKVRAERLGVKVLVDGRLVLKHLPKKANVNDIKNRRKSLNDEMIMLMKLLGSYMSFNKAKALFYVLKVSNNKLRLEYVSYALLGFISLLLVLILPMIATITTFLIVAFAILYYMVDFRFHYLQYAVLYALFSLISRVLRAMTLTIYLLVYKCIKLF